GRIGASALGGGGPVATGQRPAVFGERLGDLGAGLLGGATLRFAGAGLAFGGTGLIAGGLLDGAGLLGGAAGKGAVQARLRAAIVALDSERTATGEHRPQPLDLRSIDVVRLHLVAGADQNHDRALR